MTYKICTLTFKLNPRMPQSSIQIQLNHVEPYETPIISQIRNGHGIDPSGKNAPATGLPPIPSVSVTLRLQHRCHCFSMFFHSVYRCH